MKTSKAKKVHGHGRRIFPPQEAAEAKDARNRRVKKHVYLMLGGMGLGIVVAEALNNPDEFAESSAMFSQMLKSFGMGLGGAQGMPVHDHPVHEPPPGARVGRVIVPFYTPLPVFLNALRGLGVLPAELKKLSAARASWLKSADGKRWSKANKEASSAPQPPQPPSTPEPGAVQ